MLDLKNSFLLAPLKLGYSDGRGMITDRHVDFYTRRSAHLGAISLEPLYLDKSLREIPTQIGIDDDDKIPGLRRVVEALHATRTQAIAHLNHPGRMANPKLPGNVCLSSTAVPCENGGATPKRMDRKDMDQVIRLFVDAGLRAQKVGFDILELQMGHGYLLAQFLSPAVNDRQDEYGGSFENRLRFPMEVFEALKEAVDLPIIVRLSGDEMTPNGIKIDESIALAKRLEERGVAAIHVSAGTVCSTPPWFFQHMFIPKGKTWELAGRIKDEVEVPVVFVGRINSPKDVRLLEEKYHADYVALGRALVADPDFVAKYLGIIDQAIRPCLACSEGCLGGVKSGQGLHCVVNPLIGHEHEPLPPAPKPKHYAVVGGGLAGLEAALTLRQRGHQVTLFEKDRLGGQFNLAYLPPNKQSLKEIIDYFEYEIQRSGVKVVHKEAGPEDLLGRGFDGVILATGALPAIPPIEGLKEYYWAEFLLDENLPHGEKIVVIGGGLIGLEIASKLVEKENKVIIIEMLDEVARGMEMIEKTLTLKKLRAKGVPIHTQARVERIAGDQVYVRAEKDFVLDGVDRIVVATGMKSYNPLEKELKGKIPVWVIGDAASVGKAQDAIRSGYQVAKEL